ncbi:MAG: CvpA family protein [Candidatus Eisenbacteria bacterium]|uniref:CvpA family protein n=1 Tax=Eiseniibacteriota bacterium TaxID=2212470 RepID=A0A849SPQ4_UNCEI|nr:CvpA family protein [Candidatus Eisenbacteria bacterium]
MFAGFSWLDWALIVLVAAFAVRGALQGFVTQFFALIGLFAGVWVTGWVAQWVGAHWIGARPAVIFWLLRWLVASLSGFAVLAVCQWWGGKLGETTRKSAWSTFDRIIGVPVGVVMGVAIAAFALLAAIRAFPAPRAEDRVASARLAPRLLHEVASVTASGSRFLPGHEWLGRQFAMADRRVRERRAGSTNVSGS